MMAASEDQRLARACAAMKNSYGIPAITVRDAVKQLVKINGYKWEYIEHDNYNVVFEYTKNQKFKHKHNQDKSVKSREEHDQNIKHNQDHYKSVKLKREESISNDEVEIFQFPWRERDQPSTSKRWAVGDKAKRPKNSIQIEFFDDQNAKAKMRIIEALSDNEDGTYIKLSERKPETSQFDIVSSDDEVGNFSCKANLEGPDPISVIRHPSYVQDIARGEERLQIPLFNHNGTMELPKFFYITKNIAHKEAYVNFSLARISDESCCSQCVGNCVSSELPCACAAETRGEFAYTSEGLLKEAFVDEAVTMCQRPKRHHFYYCENCPLETNHYEKYKRRKSCKGHLMRKFIKECWNKCGCNKKLCSNRVVQRGITASLQVFSTEGKGWGVRCVHALKKGEFVCEYVGEIVTNQELHLRNKRRKNIEEHTYPVLLDADWGSERVLKDEEALCLDATEYGNCARFINHRCVDANLVEIPVEMETPDHHYYHIAFFAARNIEPMEELNWDYGIQFDDKNHPIKAFKCRCGSKFCRDKELPL